MANILWLDNDDTYLSPFVTRLEFEGHVVERVVTVIGAEQALEHPSEKLGGKERWDLILIDIMMPVGNESDDKVYTKSSTQKGKRTGIVFFIHNRNRIEQDNIDAAFLTIRGDEEPLRDELRALGFSDDHIKYKMGVADSKNFVEWVECLLSKGERHEHF